MQGLLAWYTNDPKTALSEFNQSRKDGEWGKQALINMIEIYLNPDNIELFQETAEAKGDNSEQVGSAEKLLADLQGLNEPELALKVSVLECYVHMASKNKSRIDVALNSLVSLVSTDATRDYVPALLAMANAFVLRGEPAKARNQLKRISKMNYDPGATNNGKASQRMRGARTRTCAYLFCLASAPTCLSLPVLFRLLSGFRAFLVDVG